jgi:cytoskeletal protein CcmA (bactofilin family)
VSNKNTQWFSVGILVITLVLLTALVAPALAGETRSGQEVTVEIDEVVTDDLYCLGEIITVDGVVQGDLIAAAREIHVNGTVTGDVIGAAQTIIINGKVGDDARIAGFELQISENGQVGDDLNAAGFSLTAEEGSQIGGDLYVFARQVELSGQLDGKLVGSMDALKIAGTIEGDVTVDVSAPDGGPDQIGPLAQLFPVSLLPSGLHIADTAEVNGKLTYTSAGVGDISSEAQIDQEVYQTPAPAATPEEEMTATPDSSEVAVPPVIGALSILLGILWWIIQILRRFISLLVITLLLAWLVPAVVPQAASALKKKPWPSLGWGCLIQIIFFPAMAIIFFLIIGAGLVLGLLTLGGLQGYFISLGLVLQALLAVVFGIVTAYVTKIVVAYFVGNWLWEKAKFKPTNNIIWPTLIGIVLFVMVRSIPILGWLVGWAVTLFGLGALWLWLHNRLWPPREATPQLPEPEDIPASPASLTEGDATSEVLSSPAEEEPEISDRLPVQSLEEEEFEASDSASSTESSQEESLDQQTGEMG